jgi:hypothetical protein
MTSFTKSLNSKPLLNGKATLVDKLNQYAIGKILGSKMTPVKRGHFGNFGLLETTAEALRVRQASHPAHEATHFSYDQDRLVVQAFEDVRQGAATDAILWNRSLARVFADRCRQLGLDASDAFLNRRLINIRKNIRRYEKHGISISPATKCDTHPSIVPQYAHAIEFALVRLRYRYGASIDDILLDPAMGEKFEHLASELAPDLSDVDFRLGALYIRKTRHFQKTDMVRIERLDVDLVEKAWSTPVSLAQVNPANVPSSPGLIEIKEGGRYLYISRNEDIRPAANQLRTGKAFDLVANGFWTPRLNEITFQFVIGAKVGGIGVGIWERRLIRDREPIFNWPIQPHAA